MTLECSNAASRDANKLVLSIDVGIKNLALVLINVCRIYKLSSDNNQLPMLRRKPLHLEVCQAICIDITTHIHNKVTKCECKLGHERNITDWMEHVYQEHGDMMQEADLILIERQPLTGLVAVEQSIYAKYRPKAHLICPRSMHKYFEMKNLTYDERKERVTINKYKII